MSYLRYARFHPFWPVTLLLVALGAIAGALLVHWAFWVLAALAVAGMARNHHLVRSHYLYGDLTPALVVARDPLRVAVWTDLTKMMDGRDYGVVKVIRPRMPADAGRQVDGRVRLATVSLYQHGVKDAEYAHWVDFMPRLIDGVIPDREEVDRTFEAISADLWATAEEAVARLPRSPSCGLYALDWDLPDDPCVPASSWVVDGDEVRNSARRAASLGEKGDDTADSSGA